MFDKLREHKLKAKRSKCGFAHSRVKYLGHVVGSGELRVDPDKVLAELSGQSLAISREFSNSSDLLTITTVSYVALHV